MNAHRMSPMLSGLRLGFLLGCSLSSSFAYAQDGVSAYAQSNLTKDLRMVPPSQTVSYSFWVDQTDSFSLSLASVIKNLNIQLVDPKGTIFVFGQTPSDQFQSLIYPDPQMVPDAPGAHYYLNIGSPARGQWALQIVAPNVPNSTLITPFNITFNNQVGSILTGGAASAPLGSQLAFGMAVLDGTNKVGSLQINSILYRLDDPTVLPVPVAFADDGQGADFAAGDLIYSVSVAPTQPGKYMLRVEVSGDASTGHFQRSIASDFKIVPRTARIIGTFKERVIPAIPR